MKRTLYLEPYNAQLVKRVAKASDGAVGFRGVLENGAVVDVTISPSGTIYVTISTAYGVMARNEYNTGPVLP